MTDEVLMVVLVLGLEFLVNNIGINDKYTMGSSVGSFDDTTHGKIPVGSLPENKIPSHQKAINHNNRRHQK